MATWDDAEQALLDAIKATADRAANANHQSVSLKWATAASQLAEAHAWLSNPAQPHGGAPTLSD